MIDCVITSPPYGDAVGTPSLGSVNKDDWGKDGRSITTRRGLSAEYGHTAGQLGGMAVGDLAAILTSPPFANSDARKPGPCLAQACEKYGVGTSHAKQDWEPSKDNLAALRPGTPPGEVTMECETIDWPMSEVYSEGWGDLIVKEAYAHPAKYSKSLIFKIVAFLLERGYVRPGEIVGDPFGGVALGGIACAYSGIRWIGCELEPKFVTLAQANIDLHRRELEILGCPLPVIVQGDSRDFARIVGEAAGIVTSPPYAGRQVQNGSGIDFSKVVGGGPNCQGKQADYGHSVGQLGAMPPGDVAAVLTSPPYEKTFATHEDPIANMQRRLKAKGVKREDSGILRQREGGALRGLKTYTESPGSVAGLAGDTYWAAVRDIYAQCLLALRPGGWLIVVVKGYVSKRKLVGLPAQTAALLQHLGFDLRILARAWLVERKEHAGLFGQTVVEEKSRKSFFRRLAEKKDSPRIDFEQVIFARTPDGPGGGIDAAVTSPPYADSLSAGFVDRPGLVWGNARYGHKDAHTEQSQQYGHSPGQLGSLPAGRVEDVLKEDAP